MKYFFILIFSFVITLPSCNKYKASSGAVAAVQVTNAIVGGVNIGFNLNLADSIGLYNVNVFTVKQGNVPISLFPTNDPKRSYYNETQLTEQGGIYSLFIGGKEPNIESIWVKENIPASYTDSSLGIRIINLSPNSGPVNITTASATATNIFFQISYKQMTEFTKLPLKKVIPSGSVTFQVRSSANNALLTSYTLPSSVNNTYPNISTVLSRNRNLTLVIKGLQGTTSGKDAFGVFPVANY